jgi:peptidoglycan/LPS O-acetylase OafA/YrhL
VATGAVSSAALRPPATGASVSDGTAVIPYLDGLRGLAALLVVVSHFSNRTMLGFDAETLIPAFLDAPRLPLVEKLVLGAVGSGGGQLGVMLFFTLSSFLMFHLYFERPSTLVSLHNFVAARIARIFPLYYFVLIVAVLSTQLLPFTFIAIKPDELLQHVLFVQGNSVLWTIAPELMFYLVFMLFWLILQHQRALMLGIATAIILLLNFMPVVWKTHTFDFFMLGVLLFYYQRSRIFSLNTNILQYFYPLCFAITLGLLLPAVHTVLLFDPPLGGWEAPHYLLMVGFLFFLVFESKILQRIFSSRLMRFFGDISFSMYLTHLFVLNGLTHYGLIGPNFASLGLALALTTLLATALFHGLERPSRRALRRRLATAG